MVFTNAVRRALRKARLTLAAYIILGVLYLAFPHYSQLIATLMFYMILAQAFNIFMGMTGYIDFGYVAFVAMGAYGMALAVESLYELGWASIIVGFLLAVALSVALASMVGAIALRLRGAYFAIATIGVNEGVRYLIEGANLVGGSEGVIIVRELRATFGRETANFIMTGLADLALLLIGITAVMITALILSTRVGYALQAIREDEDAARALGINVTRYKVMAFTISAGIGGLLGAANWALKGGYVEPAHVFNIHYTVEAIVMVMLGGPGTLLGPIIGGLFYGSMNYFLGVIKPGLQLLFLAPILLAVVVALPKGLMGYVRERVKDPRLRELLT